KHGHGMDLLSEKYLGHVPLSYKDVAGTGKSQVTFDRVALDKATEYAAEDADVTLRLWQTFKPLLHTEKVTTVYETEERPLVPVLAAMEREGIKVDRDKLSRLSSDFSQRMAALEAEAYEQAGEEFKISSPKQLGEILFEKMGIEGGKKTKTGAWVTDADVLEGLAAEGHELPRTIVDWRTLSKLRSTYTEALQAAINKETGRVHTSFSMAVAQTGRLSSSDPNLQNIPVRTEEGRKIREAFIADEGNVLVSADYSQIELRVLAHMADIDALKTAFRDGLDIHAMTASEMFGVPIEGMDPMVRRQAKAINFGIIYGISGFGLARQLGIPQSEASEYIKTYFKRFPGIRAYMDETKAFAKEHGFVQTAFGRKVHLAGIKSKGPQKAFAERQAINAPIQGSAADIIKRAMIRMPEALAKAKLKARMLLQVHDELVFECPESEAEKLIQVAKETMQSAAGPAMDLSVPLEVDARAAANWADAH
ncbi:DNA polymerase I, partial [Hyphomonas sp.]|uniref:DNA polymerase I n=1 Tax=Hyphomonas sp. TaxID=87 RepID=UPI003242E2BB